MVIFTKDVLPINERKYHISIPSPIYPIKQDDLLYVVLPHIEFVWSLDKEVNELARQKRIVTWNWDLDPNI